jgi:predicted signal transduction protein with EAL and GGDEF domain
LSGAIAVAGLPTFTVSGGVVDAKIRENLPDVLARADVALYQAKDAGRDQVVVHDAAGEVIPRAEDQSDLAESSRTLAAVSDVRRKLR